MHSFHYDQVNKPLWPGDNAPERQNTTTYVNIHFNGDYSGNVKINVRANVAEEDLNRDVYNDPEFEKTYPLVEIEVPFEALKGLFANYITARKIEKLENMTTEEILDNA